MYIKVHRYLPLLMYTCSHRHFFHNKSWYLERNNIEYIHMLPKISRYALWAKIAPGLVHILDYILKVSPYSCTHCFYSHILRVFLTIAVGLFFYWEKRPFDFFFVLYYQQILKLLAQCSLENCLTKTKKPFGQGG